MFSAPSVGVQEAGPSPCPLWARREPSEGGGGSSCILLAHHSLSGGLTQIKDSAEMKLSECHSIRAKRDGNIFKQKA